MCGTEAKEKLTAQTAPAIYTVMQDYYVNGMPCDPSDTVIEQTDTTFSCTEITKIKFPIGKQPA